MSTKYSDHDNQLEDARLEVRRASAEEKKAQDELTEKKLVFERQERFGLRAEKKVSDARQRLMQARRSADDAKRKGDEARRRGLPKHKWDAEVRRWETEAQRADQDIRRSEEEARRFQRDARAASDQMREKGEGVVALIKTAHSAQQRYSFLLKRPNASQAQLDAPLDGTGAHVPDTLVAGEEDDPAVADTPEHSGTAEAQTPPGEQTDGDEAAYGERGPDHPPAHLEITAGARAFLGQTLGSVEHQPGQLLRLHVDDQGSLSLYVDARKQSDSVVAHEGLDIMVIDAEILPDLYGARLDVTETHAGLSIFLDR